MANLSKQICMAVLNIGLVGLAVVVMGQAIIA